MEGLDPEDLRVFTYSDIPQGGWSFNMPTGVHIIHIPTGLEAKANDYRSQHKNKVVALANLTQMVLDSGAK